MFEKKSYLYSENMGVCYVEDVTRLVTAQKKEVQYYVLRSVYRKDRTAYIPVENHTVELRQLMDAERAKELLLSQPELNELAVRLGVIESGTDEEQQDYTDPALEKEEENRRLAMQYKMEDTLPIEERRKLYEKGEIEFVIKRELLKQEEKTNRKRNGRKNERS